MHPTLAPKEYWKNNSLNLATGSCDEKGAKKYRKQPNVPHQYVADMQADLINLGYLPVGGDDGVYGRGTNRAVTRFQRHANRSFRMKGKAKIVVARKGLIVSGECNLNTAVEIHNWTNNGYALPFALYKLVKIDGGTLREDAAVNWKEAIAEVHNKGGILVPGTGTKYSDTTRFPGGGFRRQSGKNNSKVSMHYTGRTVDLLMELGGGSKRHWWIVKDPVGSSVFWQVLCKTSKQDGSQGTKINKRSRKHYDLFEKNGDI